MDSKACTPRSKTKNDRAKRRYSLIGGTLIGASVSFPVPTLDVGEGYGELTLGVSLLLTLIVLQMQRLASQPTERNMPFPAGPSRHVGLPCRARVVRRPIALSGLQRTLLHSHERGATAEHCHNVKSTQAAARRCILPGAQ
jgi:hypothetical protein